MKIALSKCLLGERCRYDGSGSKDDFVVDVLSQYSEFIAYCPEEMILGVPRETMRLVNDTKSIKVIGNKTKNDYTADIYEYGIKVAKQIQSSGVCGIILKSKSPSCGIDRVKVYDINSFPQTPSIGIFAKAIKDTLVHFPIEDEKRLLDDWLRENFVMQIFAYDDMLSFCVKETTIKDLVEFHSNYKFLLLSKNQVLTSDMGNIVANKEHLEYSFIKESYFTKFKEAIAQKNSTKTTVNVLNQIYSYLKTYLDNTEKDEIFDMIEEFRDNTIPLITIIKIYQHYINKYNIEYLKNQKFLFPYPSKLALRSSTKAYRVIDR